MTNNQTGFKITDEAAGWNRADFDDVFVRKDCFLDGGLWLWGAGSYGRLGNNATTNMSSPIQTISGGTNWRLVSAVCAHTAATKTDGTLWLWGDGGNGRFGNNSTASQSSPVQTISGGTNWRLVSTGGFHTAAIKTDGTLWTWGTGGYGRLGNNTVTNTSSPVQTISGGTSWRTVSVSRAHTAATKTDGTLWLWGAGGNGQLGNNLTNNQSSPVQTVSGGTTWRTASVGNNHTAATKTDGTLWLWGYSIFGQLGNNSNTSQSSPVQTISGGTSWRTASAGATHSAAIKTDGTLWTWGNGSSGRLGNNCTISRSSPIQTVSGGASWRTVSAGYATAAIKTDGSLWLWGAGSYGRLGNNDITNQSSPVQTISGGTSWRSAYVGATTTITIREDCW
jgi:alpha-tubulin suppressor-like RCC1 family protein